MTAAAAASIATARTNMVENQVRTNDVTDLDVQDAMRAAPRERLCPPGRAALAYAETRIAYAPDWLLAEPREVAKLLQALQPRRGERALAVAAPYAALVLAGVGLHVTALQPPEGAPDFLSAALGEAGVVVRTGRLDALGGLGPFDVMITEGAVERAPAAWTDALAEGGRLAVVERSGPVGKARLYVRADDGGLARREVFDATPPLMPGFAAPRAFSL